MRERDHTFSSLSLSLALIRMQFSGLGAKCSIILTIAHLPASRATLMTRQMVNISCIVFHSIYVDSRVREIVQFAYKFCEPIEPNSKLSAPQHISLIDYLAYILGFIRKPIQIHSSSTSFAHSPNCSLRLVAISLSLIYLLASQFYWKQIIFTHFPFVVCADSFNRQSKNEIKHTTEK